MMTDERLPLETRLQALGKAPPSSSDLASVYRITGADFFSAMAQMTGNPYYMEIYRSKISRYCTAYPTFAELVNMIRHIRQPEREELLFHLLIEPFFTSEVKK